MRKSKKSEVVKPKVDLKAPEYRYLKEQGLGAHELSLGHNTVPAERVVAQAASELGIPLEAVQVRQIKSPAPPELPIIPVSFKRPENLDLTRAGEELEAQRQREAEALLQPSRDLVIAKRVREVGKRFREAREEDDRGEV